MEVLRLVWQKWKLVAQLIGHFQARVLMTVFYFVIFAPFALGVKLFADPLRTKRPRDSNWIPRPAMEEAALARARRQA